MNITLKILRENEEWLKKHFGGNEIIAIPNASMSFFSVARHYGGCRYNGKSYTYNPTDDSLIRDDVLKLLSKHLKAKPVKLVKQQETGLGI